MGYYYFIHRCGFSRPDPKSYKLKEQWLKEQEEERKKKNKSIFE